MQKYIALLRGINVGGNRIIKMEALRKSLSRLPLFNLSTYIQSGNLLFESESDAGAITEMITNAIEKEFGFSVEVLLITPEELKIVMIRNPFQSGTTPDSVQPYVSFLSEIPDKQDVVAFQNINFEPDKWVLDEKCVYIWYDQSAAKTKLTNSVIENKLKVKATARNWKTVRKLLDLS